MVMVVNRAPGPRSFNVKGAASGAASQITLQPGESADLDLMSEDEPVLKAWMENDEVLVGGAAQKFMKKRQVPMEQLTKRAAELRAELAQIEAQMGDDGDAAEKTPPHQFGGDGGPKQMPTVDGRAGAPTPAQTKKG